MTNLTLDATKPALAPAELLDAMHWRYATKRFDPSRAIPAKDWQALEEALVLTPSAFGLQPWKFLVVTDSSVKARLREVSWGQTQVEECSHLVVFAARISMTQEDIDRLIDRVAQVRGTSKDSLSGYRDMMTSSLLETGAPGQSEQWASRQTYIALGTLLTATAVLGIDACPLEGLDPKAYDGILGLSGSGYQTLAACAVGYRAETDGYATLPKVRFPLDEVIQRF